jgi:glycosyltransferase involved in cell wall biosynthesis
MPKICIDARLIGSSGIGTYLREILTRLSNLELVLIAHPIIKEKYAWDFCQWILTDAAVYSLQEQFLLSRLIPTCDLFWSPYLNMPFFPIRARRCLITIHDLYHLQKGCNVSFWKRWYAYALIKKILSTAEALVTVSFFSKQQIDRCLRPKCPVHVIKNGSARKEEQGSAPLPLPPFFILFVGQIRPHKLGKLLEAFCLLKREKFPDLHLVLVGRQVEKPPFRHRKDIHFLGEVTDPQLSMCYQKAALFIFPSLYEGFGLPPLEAMHYGCPVLVSHCASLPEVCGDAALYFNPFSAHEIANAITLLLMRPDLRADLIAKGKMRSAQFSWEESARQHEKLLVELCKQPT